jgi:hypothetical protein
MYGMKRAEGRKGKVERAVGRKGWLKRANFGLAGTLIMMNRFY